MNLKTTSTHHPVASYLLATGLMLGLFPVLGFCLSSLTFLCGIPISEFHLVITVLAALGLTYWVQYAMHNFHKRAFTASIFTFSVVLIGGIWHMAEIYDNSYDGMWYHQEAVYNLAKGWNPFKRFLVPTEGTPTGTFYDNHYPKGAWIAGSIVYRLTHLLETAKVNNLALLVSTIFLSWYTLFGISNLSKWLVWPMGILLGANPVSIYQSYSFYVDGQLASCLTCTILLLVVSIALNSRSMLWMGLLFFVYTANLKFTGLVYGSLFIAAYLFFQLWRKRSDLKYYLLSVSVAFVMAIGVFGYPTYITNLINNGHPLFPIMGPNAQGEWIAKIPQPANFEHLNRFQKFFIASSANPVWCRAPLNTQPKSLFKALPDPYYFTRADFEISGLGPYFTEIGIGVLLLWLLIPFVHLKYKPETLALTGILLFSVFINSEAWYARYAPQLWIVLVLPVFIMLQHNYLKYLSLIVAVGLGLNLWKLATIYYPTHQAESAQLRKEFEWLKQLKQPARIWVGWPITFDIKAREMQLPYQAINPNQEHKDNYAPFCGFSSEWALYHKDDLNFGKTQSE